MIILKEINSESIEHFSQTWANQAHRFEDIYAKYTLIQELIEKKALEQADLYRLFDPNGERHPSRIRQIQRLAASLDLINTYKGKGIEDIGFLDLIPCKQVEWKTILCHLVNPAFFPIFNKDMYRAFLYNQFHLRDERLLKKSVLGLYEHFFLPYFHNQDASGVLSLTYQMALEILGRFLKSPYGKTLTKTVSLSYIHYLLEHHLDTLESMKREYHNDFYWKRIDSFHIFKQKEELLQQSSVLPIIESNEKEINAMLQAIGQYYGWDHHQLTQIYEMNQFITKLETDAW